MTPEFSGHFRAWGIDYRLIWMRQALKRMRFEMAAEGDVKNDYQAHSKGYERFLGLMKWGTILSFIATAIVVLLIAS
jgi:hypothetical protein